MRHDRVTKHWERARVGDRVRQQGTTRLVRKYNDGENKVPASLDKRRSHVTARLASVASALTELKNQMLTKCSMQRLQALPVPTCDAAGVCRSRL